MLCQDCPRPKKSKCTEICNKLRRHLKRFTRYQRESTQPNHVLEWLSENGYPIDHQELFAFYNEYSVGFQCLTPLQNNILSLRVLHGLAYKQIAHRLSNQHRRLLSHAVRYQLYSAKRKLLNTFFINKGDVRDG